MQLKVVGREIRLDQLTEEVRALPGLSRLQGLSARLDEAAGEVEVTVHVGAMGLTTEEERAVEEAVARHVRDPQWGASQDDRELVAMLSRAEGSLSLGDVEKALRAMARILDLRLPGAPATTPAINGSTRE